MSRAAASLPGGLSRRSVLAAAGGLWLAGLSACSKTQTPADNPAAASATAGGIDARQAFQAASGGTGFQVGQAMAARSLLVFFDPQCPHCAELWTSSRPLQDRVRMVWMPVAFINASSAPQGALLLTAANPAVAMDEHEALLKAEKGGLPVSGPADAAVLAQIKANTALWSSLGATSVPHMVYRAGPEGPYGVGSGGWPTDRLAQALGL